MAQPHKYDIIKFDTAGNLDPVTLVLCYRSGERIGAINNYTGFTVSNDMGNPQEISFSITKRVTWIWDKVVDFLVVWVVEWDRYFEISTPIDESISSIKNVTGMHLAEAELSQALIHDAEFGNENDIEYSDNKNDGYTTYFYDKDNPKYSLLDRLFADKGMNFEIIHVDTSLCRDSREFSFDGTSLYDALMEIAEEVRCIFVFDTCTADDGSIRRLVYVYDLESYCEPTTVDGVEVGCKHRGEFEGKCPKCGNTNIKSGFGEDTTIFLSRENLVNSVSYSVDKDSVKNCFKLESGDELFDAAIMTANPAGSMYIWYIPEEERYKMSEELRAKLTEYETAYDLIASGKDKDGNIRDDATFSVSATEYNTLVEKYNGDPWDCEYIPIPDRFIGFSSLVASLYDIMDFKSYLQTSMMPAFEMSDTPLATEALADVIDFLRNHEVGINGGSIGEVTATNAIRNMAESVIDSRFKVSVKSRSITSDEEAWITTYKLDGKTEKTALNKYWYGSITVDAYATPEKYDAEDKDKYTAVQEDVVIHVSTNYEAYLRDIAEKILGNEDTEDYSIKGLFEKPLNSELGEGQDYTDTFEYALTKYSMDMLKHFSTCCQGVLTTLAGHSIGKEPAADSWEGQNKDCSSYWTIYYPYYERSMLINEEIAIREAEIETITQVKDDIDDVRKEVAARFDMAIFLGEKCWKELNSFRREDVYSNSNFTSEGLSNNELLEWVNDFMDIANKELVKSATLQHTISSDLKNLFLIPEFAPLLDHFAVGNWMRIEVDETFYKLRLLSYIIDYENFESSDVTFSDVTKGLGVRSDVDSVISNMKKISSSYSYVARQAEKGNEAQQTTNNWLTNGWNSALAAIKNNDHEEITYDNYGLWCKSFDPITETYSDKQARFTSNILAMTNDNWKTVSIGLGEHEYQYYNKDKELVVDTDYGLSAKFVTAGYVNGSQIIGGEIFSQNYTDSLGTYIDLNNGNFSFAGGKLKYLNDELIVSGNITTTSGKIGGWDIGQTKLHSGSSGMGSNSEVYAFWAGTDKFTVKHDGTLVAKSATIEGAITATVLNATQSGKIGFFEIGENFLTGERLSLYAGDSLNGSSISMHGSYDFPDAESTYMATGMVIHNSTHSMALRVQETGIEFTSWNGDNLVFNINCLTGDINSKGKISTTGEITAKSCYTTGNIGADGNYRNKFVTDNNYYNTLRASVVEDEEYTCIGNATYGTRIYGSGNIYKGSSTTTYFSTTSSSDERLKEFCSDMTRYEHFFEHLCPKAFVFHEGLYNMSKRKPLVQWGFYAQEVVDAFNKSKLDWTQEEVVVVEDGELSEEELKYVENGTLLKMNYQNIIALNTHMIQKVIGENNQLKQRIEQLEQLVNQLIAG